MLHVLCLYRYIDYTRLIGNLFEAFNPWGNKGIFLQTNNPFHFHQQCNVYCFLINFVLNARFWIFDGFDLNKQY